MHAIDSGVSAGTTTAQVSTQMVFTGLGHGAGISERGEQVDVLLSATARAASLAIFTARSSSGEVRRFHATSVAPRVFGLCAEQVEPGVNWLENVYPSDRARVREYWQRAKNNDESIDYRLIVDDGDLMWVRHWALQSPPLANDDLGYHVIQPITEEKFLEWECLQISEREAVRIGQELHDDACQVLFGIACLLRGLSVRARERGDLGATEIDELTAQATNAADRLRTLSHTLFRAKTNRRPIAEVLQQAANDAAKIFHVHARFECTFTPPHHAEEQVIQLFRIVQEAINNAVRHGRATSIVISLSHDEGETMRLTVEDNGTGLPADLSRPEGIGISVMQYRARMMDGTFELKPASPHGVIVEITYPALAAQPKLL